MDEPFNFNTGQNFPSGGTPEGARVNGPGMDAETRKAEILQQNTIKALTEAIQTLTKQYEDFTSTNQQPSESDSLIGEELKEKIQNLNEILQSLNEKVAKKEKPVSLGGIGVKERVQTFDKLTSVIQQFQKNSLEYSKTSQDGKPLDFDTWFASQDNKKQIELGLLKSSKNNVKLLSSIKALLIEQNIDPSGKLSSDSLTLLAQETLNQTIDQKERDLIFFQQNKDIIKLNKTAQAKEQENVKKLISAANFDPSKPILEFGFKSISKDMDILIKNSKHRSLLRIVADLMGPMGPIFLGIVKFVVMPAALLLGILTGFLTAQLLKLKAIGMLLDGSKIMMFWQALVSIATGLRIGGLRVFSVFELIATRLGQVATVFTNIVKTLGNFTVGKLSAWFPAFMAGLQVQLLSIRGYFSSIIIAIKESSIFINARAFILSIANIGSMLFSAFASIGVAIKTYILAFLNTGFVRTIGSGLSRAFTFLGRGFGSIGTRIGGWVTWIEGIFTPIARFLGSAGGRATRIFDYLFVGILNIFNFGTRIGKILGGWSGPIMGVLAVLQGLPNLWKMLWSGNMRTALKGIMTVITQLVLLGLSNVFGGPIIGIAAAMALSFEKVFAWFEPLFDLIIDIGESVWEMVSFLYEEVVKPILDVLGVAFIKVVDVVFMIVNPLIKWLRGFVVVLQYTLIPMIMLSFKIVMWIFKKIADTIFMVWDSVVSPVISFVADVFNMLYDALESTVRKVVQGLIKWYNNSWFSSVTGKITDPYEAADRQKREAQALKDAADAKTLKATNDKNNANEMKDAVKQGSFEGVKDGLKKTIAGLTTNTPKETLDNIGKVFEESMGLILQGVNGQERNGEAFGGIRSSAASLVGMVSSIIPSGVGESTKAGIAAIRPSIKYGTSKIQEFVVEKIGGKGAVGALNVLKQLHPGEAVSNQTDKLMNLIRGLTPAETTTPASESTVVPATTKMPTDSNPISTAVITPTPSETAEIRNKAAAQSIEQSVAALPPPSKGLSKAVAYDAVDNDSKPARGAPAPVLATTPTSMQVVSKNIPAVGKNIKGAVKDSVQWISAPAAKQNFYIPTTLAKTTEKDDMDRLFGMIENKEKEKETTIVNNNNNSVINNSSSSGKSGMTYLPIISGGHTDPTKISVQVSYRPPG